MRSTLFLILALLVLFYSGLPANAPENSIALKGAKVYTAVGPPIPNAIVLVQNGKITAVGRNVKIPNGIRVIDATGKVIIPGLIDLHTHIGAFVHDSADDNEMPQPIGPELRTIDALHMHVPDWMDAVKGGVTTVVTGPGSGERMGGQSVTIKTFGQTLEKRLLKEKGNLKMAVNARNLSHISNIRKMFIKTQEYMDAWAKYESGDKKGLPPKRDLAMEAVAGALTGENKIRCHIGYANDMMTLLKLKDEYGFDLTFIHSNEAYKIADEIAKRNVGCICMPIGLRSGVTEDAMYGNTVLHNAGVKIAFHTDDPVSRQKWLRICASMAIHYDLPEDIALNAITINPAELSGISNRVGSIEKGKDADIVVLNGTWYELKTRVDMVFVDGVLAFDRTTYEKPLQENKR